MVRDKVGAEERVRSRVGERERREARREGPGFDGVSARVTNQLGARREDRGSNTVDRCSSTENRIFDVVQPVNEFLGSTSHPHNRVCCREKVTVAFSDHRTQVGDFRCRRIAVESAR